tara:strand:+ start:1112 stop:1990 length:879 start_codon:yes stop_codon:yes gene_type:complete
VTATDLRFRLKIDGWVITATVLPVLIGLYPAGRAATEGHIWVPLVVFTPVALIGWGLSSTSYTVTNYELDVRCMWLRELIPLDSIRSLRPSRSLLSALALSLDRIELVHATGRTQVSPRDRDGFVAILSRHNPSIAVHGFESREEKELEVAGDSTIPGVALAPVIVIGVPLLLVTGVMFYRSGQPSTAQVTAAEFIVSGNYGATIELDDITSVSLEPGHPRVRHRLRGFSAGGTRRGRFRVHTLGDGLLFTRADEPPYLLVNTEDSFILLNAETADETCRLHDDLLRRWQNQ